MIGYERHKIFLYKEDIKRFQATLDDVCNHIMTVLMPDYDYDEYTRRHEEWEKERAAMNDSPKESNDDDMEEIEETEINSEDDMSW